MDNWTFTYQTEINIGDIRKSLVGLICQVLESQTPVTEAEFNKRIPRLLFGSYRLRRRKDINASVDELLWKYSELTGKYCGCQFWSNNAKHLFERKLQEHSNGRLLTLRDAKYIAACLSKKSNKEYQLVHEHVFPRAELRKLLLDSELSRSSLRLAETIERLAVGCVVLEGEHKLVSGTKGDSVNPWRRYTGKIKLFENQSWPSIHMDLIKNAGLL